MDKDISPTAPEAAKLSMEMSPIEEEEAQVGSQNEPSSTGAIPDDNSIETDMVIEPNFDRKYDFRCKISNSQSK